MGLDQSLPADRGQVAPTGCSPCTSVPTESRPSSASTGGTRAESANAVQLPPPPLATAASSAAPPESNIVPTAQSSRNDAHIALRQLFADAIETRAALLFPLAQARVDRISALPDACMCCILSFLGAASTTAYPSRNSVAAATANSRFARLSATDPRCALALSLTDAYCLTALRRLELSAVKRTHLTDRARHELRMLALVRVLRLNAALSPAEAARAGRLTKCLFGSAQPPVNSWDLQQPSLNFDALFEAFAACGTDPSDPTRVRLPHLGVADVTMGAATSAHSLALLGTISVCLRSLCLRVDERARFFTERELQIFARNAPALTQLCIVGASSLASVSVTTAGTPASLVLCDEAELAQRARAEEDDGWSCSDLAFMHIAKNCRELRALRVCGGKTGNQAMQHLSLYCPELEHLDLGYKSSHNMSEDGMHTLMRGCPRLVSFHAPHFQRVPVDIGWRPLLAALRDNALRRCSDDSKIGRSSASSAIGSFDDAEQDVIMGGAYHTRPLPAPASVCTAFGGARLRLTLVATRELEAAARDELLAANGAPRVPLDLCWRQCAQIDATVSETAAVAAATASVDASMQSDAVPSLRAMSLASAFATDIGEWVSQTLAHSPVAVARSMHAMMQSRGDLVGSDHVSSQPSDTSLASVHSLGTLALLGARAADLQWWARRYLSAPAPELVRVECECEPEPATSVNVALPCRLALLSSPDLFLLSVARASPALQRLDLRGAFDARWLQDSSIDLLAAFCPHLVCLAIVPHPVAPVADADGSRVGLGDAALRAVSTLAHLVSLTLPVGRHVTDAGLAALSNAPRLASLTLLPCSSGIVTGPVALAASSGNTLDHEFSVAAVLSFCSARAQTLVRLSLRSMFGAALDAAVLAALVAAAPLLRALEIDAAPLVPSVAWRMARARWVWMSADCGGGTALLVGGIDMGATGGAQDNDCPSASSSKAASKSSLPANMGDSDSDDELDARQRGALRALHPEHDPIRAKYAKLKALREAPKQSVEWRAEFGREQKDLDKKVFMGALNMKNISAEFG